ncbi:MAG: 30S ribosome-binding factor RbfA [Acidobacteriota bacterium]
MSGNRAIRLAETIRQEASDIVEYELTDERLSNVKVTSVKISPDLRNATIFVDIEGGKQEIDRAIAALRHATGFIRYQLASRLQLKRAPDLLFKYDDTSKKAARIEELLREETETGQET